MTSYYATCDADGPISVRLETPEVNAIEEHGRQWIDDCRTDAEDAYSEEGWEGWTEQQVAAAMEAHGYHVIHSTDIAGDWVIWEK